MKNSSIVINFFKEFSAIPRASYDEKRVSDYLVNFAETRGLEVVQDKHNNVLIKKPATIPNCKCAPVIIQGHMDMVYVQAPKCTRAYEDGISVIEKNGWLCADGTTLGADNGIAVAYALAILDSSTISHPDLEIVITVQEEVGHVGAANFDCSQLKGKYMLNLDTEDEGVIYASSAGAFRNDFDIPIQREVLTGKTALKIGLGGMFGGHSGIEIHLGRANAIVLMARLLAELQCEEFRLSTLNCGGKMNAIASHCEAVLYVDMDKLDRILDIMNTTVAKFNYELQNIDTVELSTELLDTYELSCYTCASATLAINTLLTHPNGVKGMSTNVKGLVQTSVNIGILAQKDDKLCVSSLTRSSIGSRKDEERRRFIALAEITGGSNNFSNDYPQWEYRKDSPLRELTMDCYRELFGREAVSMAIHAGLECGYFDAGIPDVDIIAIGPDQRDVHTPNEKANINSIGNVMQLICRMLEKLAKS